MCQVDSVDQKGDFGHKFGWDKAHQTPFSKSDLEGPPDPQLQCAVSEARPNKVSCPGHLKAACTQTQGTIGHGNVL